MNKNIWIIAGTMVLVIIAGGMYTSINIKDDAMTEQKVSEVKDTMMKDGVAQTDDMTKKDETSVVDTSNTMMKVGSYEAYAPEKVALASASHDVVLFFRASWCPTCKTLDVDIRTNLNKIPSSLTILNVDYDHSSDLKKRYGVTYQHTFVQVDKDGRLLKKWSGSPTLTALVSEVR